MIIHNGGYMTGCVSDHECEAVLLTQSLLSKSKNPCLCFSGGKNSTVLLHMVKQLAAPGNITIIHIETGAEFSAVQSYIQKMKKLWKLNLIIDISSSVKESNEGNKELCCHRSIYEPIEKIIKTRNFDGIFIGEISGSNKNLSNFLSDAVSDKLLSSPLLSFTHQNIWEYIKSHNLPYCSLYREGYNKIDCEPCSLKEKNATDISLIPDDEKLIKEKLKKLGYL